MNTDPKPGVLCCKVKFGDTIAGEGVASGRGANIKFHQAATQTMQHLGIEPSELGRQ
jgi:hypothetical protein